MKSRLNQIIAGIVILEGVACHNSVTDETCTPENQGCKVNFTAMAETRTIMQNYSLQWVKGDKVGMFAVGSQINGSWAQPLLNRIPVEFSGYFEDGVMPGDIFYAYYPYSSSQSKTSTTVRLRIPTEQTQTAAGEFDGSSNPMVSIPISFEGEETYAYNLGGIKFRPLGAIVELRIFSSNESLCNEKIVSVSFTADKKIAGEFDYDLMQTGAEELPAITGLTSEAVTTILTEQPAVGTSKTNAVPIYLVIAPGEYSGMISVRTNEALYDFSFTSALTFQRAITKVMNADIAQIERFGDSFDRPIRFADAEVKRICVENWDVNGNGELSYREAAAVTDLGEVFKGAQIQTFDELQYFSRLTKIGDEAFYGCPRLTNIMIPDGITEVGKDAFQNCYNLAAFYGKYASADHRCWIRDGMLLAFASSGLTEYTIPDGVTSIGSSAFSNCSNLTSIDIPTGMTSIGNAAFSGCHNLTNIDIPAGITSIGKSAFSGCSSLTSITIPDEVTEIGEYAFSYCSGLTSIVIPNSVTSICTETFSHCSSLDSVTIGKGVTVIQSWVFYECNSLTRIYCQPTEPPLVGVWGLYLKSSVKIYVPTTSFDVYKAAGGWRSYASQLIGYDF